MKGSINDLGVNSIALYDIIPNPLQPRVVFDKVKLEELANNIQDNGLLQAIVVRKVEGSKYIIIAGERRYRAHEILNKNHIQARIIECDDKTAYELTLLENIQRENLSLLEEARGYKHLKEKYNYKLYELSKVTSKSNSSISNILSILEEDEVIQKYVEDGTLTLAAFVWIKQLPNRKEKIDLLEKLRNEEVKRSMVRAYVERIKEVYKLAKKFGLRPEDMLKQIDRKGKPGRFDLRENIIPEDFQFFFIVDFTVCAEDIPFLPVKNVLFSAYNFLHDKSITKRLALLLLERKRLDKMFLDSGVMPAARRKHWKFFKNMKKLLDLYETLQPDICVNADVPMYPFVFDNWKISKEEMMKITEENTKIFTAWKPSFETTKVFPLQGTTPQEYLDCFYMYKRLGVFKIENHTFGFGGLATAAGHKQVDVVKHVMADPEVQKVRKRVKFVHGFGIGNPQRIVNLYQLGVNSFDALTVLVLMATGQYWLRNGKHAHHIIHESSLVRKIRLYFNLSSFWGQLTEGFAKLRGLKLQDTDDSDIRFNSALFEQDKGLYK